MDMLDWPLKFLIAFALGAVIGLEREINEQKDLKGDTKGKHAIIGLRTFSLVAGLGAITGSLYGLFPIIAGILSAGFIVLLLLFYYLDSKLTVDPGITTEIAVIYSYILGFLVFTNLLPIQLIVAITILLVLLMSRKEDIKDFIENIQKREINALVSFAILALVILPFLPNETYAFADFPGVENFLKNVGWNIDKITNLELFNPFKLWLIVVLITGVDLFGYFLERTIGASGGRTIAAVVGGFVSSTATTISLAQQSKKIKNINPLLAGAEFANAVSFLPIAVLLATLNSTLLISFFPVLITITLVPLLIGSYYLWKSKKESAASKSDKNPILNNYHSIFSLTSALKFMGIYLLISIISKIALEFFGTSGFLITTVLGSLTGIDAIVINTAQLAGNQIDMTLAVWALILANATNLLAKSVYSFMQGSKEFAFKFLISMLLTIGASLIPGAFVYFLS
jgi:uncharacterized membrane protein (DUF4010 family)